jgi:glycine/D-amino acid oxidase-like deaminating enzyme
MPHEIPSLWAATARPPLDLPALTESLRADVLVIGAGVTGLSAALHLAESGASVALLEAQAPGHGGSGRNGGQVIPGLKDDPDTLDRLYGPEATEFAGSTAEVLFDLVARHGIDCDAQRDGWIQGSVKAAHLPLLEGRMAQWAARGAPVGMLDAGAMARATGSDAFRGGWIDRRAGRVHPLNYVTGLAEVAQRLGVRLFARSPVTALDRQGQGWRARVAGGAELHAPQVVIATNAYSGGLWPRLRATIVPANSFQVATDPLPAALLERVLPGRAVVSDSRRVANYFRIGPENRLMMGGRGGFGAPRSVADFAQVEKALRWLFPETGALGIAYRWAGRIGITADHRPHLHQPAPGVTIAIGYNGRGLALGTAMGRALARHLAEGAPLPLPVRPIRPLPLHALHRFYGAAAIACYRLRDAAES